MTGSSTKSRLLAVLALAAAPLSAAQAGPPFVTDDPEPTGYRHFEVYFYSQGTAAGGDKAGTALGLSVSHGLLPLWVRKSFGTQTAFGGGGWRINPGREGRDSWFAGWALSRQITDRFQLGAEIFGETAQVRGEKNSTGFNVGAIYDLNESFHLGGSAGAVAGSPVASASPAYYLALKWTA